MFYCVIEIEIEISFRVKKIQVIEMPFVVVAFNTVCVVIVRLLKQKHA